ncbi:MAG TPA: hypothetical protein VEB22_15310 [Phycisphaerales bacterium]|nr:hypothetical protein [Phycisphaerales bacterium]
MKLPDGLGVAAAVVPVDGGGWALVLDSGFAVVLFFFGLVFVLAMSDFARRNRG